jgi:hypothetical protein
MADKIYVVGPRPLYVGRPGERLDEAVIVAAPSQYEGEPAKRIAVRLSSTLADYFNTGGQVSCETIAEVRVAEIIARGATDLRTLQRAPARGD